MQPIPTIFRCKDPECKTRLFDHAMTLGSVIEAKCECNRTYVLMMTTLGLIVAEKKNLTYTPIPDAHLGTH